MSVLQERMLDRRLFQITGAAERKPRAPNEVLQRVTERRLAEADHRVLHGVCHWTIYVLLYRSLWQFLLFSSAGALVGPRHCCYRIGPICFLARWHKRRPEPGLVWFR